MNAEGTAATRVAAEITGCLADSPGRILVGFAGPPGCGKSTLAAQVCADLGERAVLVPLDGWHLSADLTRRLGAAGRRGAPDTFDVVGFVALLRRIRAQRTSDSDSSSGSVVFAPDFRREIEEPISGAIAVDPRTPVVVVEGNYLLLDAPHWREVRGLLDLSYYVHLDPEERRRRLVRRHVEFGKTQEEATRWVMSTDERNAALIEERRLAPSRVVPGP